MQNIGYVILGRAGHCQEERDEQPKLGELDISQVEQRELQNSETNLEAIQRSVDNHPATSHVSFIRRDKDAVPPGRNKEQ